MEESFGPDAVARVPAAPKGPPGRTGRMWLTRESKQSLGLAIKEARALRHNYIGTEHLLLGLLARPSATRAGTSPPPPCASWASIRTGPGSRCWTN